MISNIKKKNIQSFIQNIPDFDILEKNTWILEQHLTPPAIAADCLHKIYQIEDVRDYKICDLGCGTGMIITGLFYMGATYGLGIDIDKKYLNMTKNILDEKFEGDVDYDLMLGDVKNLNMQKMKNVFDLVVMNPPFGTKEEGLDYVFLKQAFEICNGNVYSFHKTSTRPFLEKKAGEHNRNLEVINFIKYPISKRYAKYHKLESKEIDVDLLCFSNIPNY